MHLFPPSMKTRVSRLAVIGVLLAAIVSSAGTASAASAEQIDCSYSPGLKTYLDDAKIGYSCVGGPGGTGGGGGGIGGGAPGSGGSGSAACHVPGTNALPAGFLGSFLISDSTTFFSNPIFDSFGDKVGVLVNEIHWKTLPSGSRQWSGVIQWTFLNYGYFSIKMVSTQGAASTGQYGVASYSSTADCSLGFNFQTTPGGSAIGVAPEAPHTLAAPGTTAGTDDGRAVTARGSLGPVPGTTNRYFLRLDVTNNTSARPTSVDATLTLDQFDVLEVISASDGVDCPAAANFVKSCAFPMLPKGTTESVNLLVETHDGAPVDAALPIGLIYDTRTESANFAFYAAKRPAPVAVDPVPTPPACSSVEDSTQQLIAGLLSRLDTFCHSGLSMGATAEHGTVTISDAGYLSYKADAAFRGVDTISVTSHNARGRISDPSVFPIEVSGPAVAVADEFTALYGVTLSSTTSVVTNDTIYGKSALPNAWHVQIGTTPPAHGTLEMHRDGTFSYAPEAGFHGLDSFLYRLEGPDGAVSNPVKVTIDVIIP